MKYSEKKNSLKNGEVSGVPLLNFEGVPDPGSQSSEVPGPGVLVPLYTMPDFYDSFLKIE